MTLGIVCLLFAPWLIVWVQLADLQGWPSNDDPFYAKPLAIWSADGRIQLVRQYGFLTASSVAHVISGWLATLGGFNFRNLYLVCIVQQAAGAGALYLLARRLELSLSTAILIAACLTTYPLYFGHAFTYMTDGPAAAWSSLASVFLTLGLICQHAKYVTIGSIAVGWGYWIRQTNAALLLAPCMAMCAYMCARDGRSRRFALPICIAILMIATFESGWLLPGSASRLRDIAPQPAEGYWRRTLIALYGWLLLVGWYVLPIAPWLIVQAWQRARQSDRTETIVCTAGAVATLLAGAVPFLATAGRASLTSSTGNFIQNGHLGPIFLSDMDEPGRWGTLAGVQWPFEIWQLLSLLSIVSASSLAWWFSWTICSTVRRWLASSLEPLVVTSFAWLATIVACVAALAFFVEPHLDRYWLFLMPVVSVFCLLLAAHHGWQLQRATAAWAIGWMAIHMIMSTIFVHDMLAWNHARWTYVQQHLAAGHSAETIDAGRDVNAWLRMDEDPDTSARPGDESRWWSGHASLCISAGPRPGWHLVTSLPWHSWSTGQTHFLFVLQRSLSNG